MISDIKIFLFFCFILFSCENDIKKVSSFQNPANMPYQRLKNVKIYYSDSAELKTIIQAPLIDRYSGENTKSIMSKGFKANLYNPDKSIRSQISAKYATYYDDKKRMEAKNNVIVENLETGEKLNTEELIWDERNALIYSDKFVKIRTKDEILYGDGFESDENFDKWKIKKPKGSFPINKNK